MSRIGTDDAVDSDGNLRRGAAKKVMSYNEAAVDYGLDSEDDQYEASAAQGGGDEAGPQEDEIDMVLGYSRDEDHLNDPKDIPQENLVRLLLRFLREYLIASAIPYQVEDLL